MINMDNLTEKEKEFLFLAANGLIAALFAIEEDNTSLVVDTCMATLVQLSKTLEKSDTMELNNKIVIALRNASPNYVVGTVDLATLSTTTYQDLKEIAFLENLHGKE